MPIGPHPDGCVFDPVTQPVFASCGEGVTTIAQEEAPNKLTVRQTLQTERGARTIALDPMTHRIYLPTAKFGPEPMQGPGAPHWPAIIPEMMKLLIYARALRSWMVPSGKCRAHGGERSFAIEPDLESKRALVEQHAETVRAARSRFRRGFEQGRPRRIVDQVINHQMRLEQRMRQRRRIGNFQAE